MVGKIPILGYFDKLNTVIADTLHMLNYLEHNNSVMDNFSDPITTYCIKTFGMMDIETGEESLFYNLDDVREKRYFYCINDEQLKNDGDLFDTINQQAISKEEEFSKVMFGIYSSQYKDNYCYFVYSSPHIQK